MTFNLDRNLEAQVSPQQFLLEQVRVGAQMHVDAYLWREAKVEYFEAAFGDLVIQLESQVLTDKLPPVEVKETFQLQSDPHPVTWWDHFKVEKLETDRWYWRWLGKLKHPRLQTETVPRTVKLNLERWVSYPEAQVVTPEMGQGYRGYTLTQEK